VILLPSGISSNHITKPSCRACRTSRREHHRQVNIITRSPSPVPSARRILKRKSARIRVRAPRSRVLQNLASAALCRPARTGLRHCTSSTPGAPDGRTVTAHPPSCASRCAKIPAAGGEGLQRSFAARDQDAGAADRTRARSRSFPGVSVCRAQRKKSAPRGIFKCRRSVSRRLNA